MQLNESQKRAVEYLDGPLLVLAGPGTGKTQLLSQKVAYILKNTDTNPENILCLTFTESGASNMRERLKTIIGKDALKVNIGTYHVFGSEILAQYKNYSESYDRRLDAAIDEVMQYKIVNAIQDKLPGSDILRGDNVKDIISVISEAKSAGLSADDLMQVAKQNMEDSEVLSSTISPYLLMVVPRVFKESYENAYLPIYNILKNYTSANYIVKNVERSIGILARDLAEAISEAEEKQKITPLSAWRDKYFEKDNNSSWRLKDRVANKKLISIANVMQRYEEHLARNGLYDFDDMIEEAAKALRDDEGFRLTLQEKYQFIMLDEFQDTNPSQFAIVKQLTDYEKPMIMAVGDDDQAIYEFQGAMSSNSKDFQEHYDAEVVALTENYRSTQEILDFSWQVIEQAPDRFDGKVPLTAHKKNPQTSEIYRYEFNSADAEYGFIADEIAKLVQSGVRQSEIAVISYKTKYFEPLLPYLKSHEEIKIAYEKRDDLFLNEKMHQLITTLLYIHETAREMKPTVQVLEILTYPWWRLPILTAVRLVGQARSMHRSVLETLAEADDDDAKSVMEFISTEVGKSFTEPLDIIMYDVMKEMDVEKLPEYEKFEFYENLAALKGKVRKHFGEKTLFLADFYEMIMDYQAAEMPMNVSNPYKDADEAVQILTAHKAKGLEFEYVFIVSADHTAWGKGKGNNNLLALPKNLIQIRHTGTTDSEKLRILYVALTRAKKSLIITNSLHDFNDKSPERLEYFEEYVDGTEVISPFLPEKSVRLKYDMVAPEVMKENLRNWLLPYITATPDMRTLYLERAEKFRMSASALTSFIDIVYAGPEAFFKSYILQVPREPETEALAFGDLVHKVFERVTNDGISDEEAVEFFLTELEKRELESNIKQKIRERGPEDLAVSLNAFHDILRQGKAEVDFATDHLVVNGVPVTGKIDHMVVDDATKTIEIYDYKTGGFHKEKWQSHATLYKYMLQLLFYKMLLNHSPRYNKYKVTRAHILFVTPDKDGEVYDKVYEYDPNDEKEFLALMRVVYQQVSTLEFLDDREIMRAADKALGIKDIKNYITLLLDKKGEK